MNIAIIPARGGSKRIPRKNIRNFCGKPMLAHSIHAALESGAVDVVVVSTDDEEIAQIAASEGAKVPFMRPQSLADDHTGTSPVVRHAIETLLADSWQIDHCACIYATAPLLSAQRIRDGLAMLESTPELDYVFTAARFSFPIQRALLQREDGGIEPFDKESIKMRSQDLPPAFHDAGQLYWGHHSTWLNKQKRIFGADSRMMVLPDHLVCDIDTEDDWQRAEVLHAMLKQQGKL